MQKFMLVSRQVQEVTAAVVQGVAVAMVTDLVGGGVGDKSVHRARVADTVTNASGSSIP